MPNPGDVAINKRTGAQATWNGQAWVVGKQQAQEASMRGRMDLGLAPMVQAQQDMAGVEAKGNPFSLTQNPDNAVAKVASDIGFTIPGLGVDFHPLNGVAKKIGGQDYQTYEQAQKAFESQLMPMMSGAAVSPSEAARQIKAALPELGDSPETLKDKARTRAMMLNGAAKARGQPLPYPDIPTWGVNTTRLPDGGAPSGQGGGAPKIRKYNPQTGRIE
jgi:hypothetical protein